MRRGCVVLALTIVASAAAAQSDPALRDRLTNAYMVDVSRQLCRFAITEDEQEALDKAIEEMEYDLSVSDASADAIRSQVEAQMGAQKAQGLCDPKGPWAKSFASRLAASIKGL